jgi:hypothetical protein
MLKKCYQPVQQAEAQYNAGTLFEYMPSTFQVHLQQSKRENQYLLIDTDHFISHKEVCPIQNEQTLSVDDILVTNFCCCFKVQKEMLSDQGWNVQPWLPWLVLCLSICKMQTKPMHSQYGGMMEQELKTVKEHT